MVPVTAPSLSLTDRSLELHSRTPFYSRNYGGFTKAQWKFFLEHAGSLERKSILDPMAGQAYFLCRLSWKGYSVLIGDINPAPLLLATLRDPKTIMNADRLRKYLVQKISRLKRFGNTNRSYKYTEDWIAPSVREELLAYVKHCGLENIDSTAFQSRSFWDAPVELRFAASIPVLAARELTCFRESDNKTWLKKGGLLRKQNVYDAVLRALNTWLLFVREEAPRLDSPQVRPGVLRIAWMDAEKGYFAKFPRADIIVTSPPYANRLDYTRMWAPEIEVLSAMFGINPAEVKSKQVGSTVVRGKAIAKSEIKQLPSVVQKPLHEIWNDHVNVSSRSYYYPFFANYALSLTRSLRKSCSQLRSGGSMIIFVRDTIRKDTLFPTSKLVRTVLSSQGLKLGPAKKHIVRSHIGMKRRDSRGGVYGLAQTEWWLTFRKE